MSLSRWIPMSVLGGVGYTQQETIADIAEAPLEIASIVRTQVEISSIQTLVFLDVQTDGLPRGITSQATFKVYLQNKLISTGGRDTSLDPWGNPYRIGVYKEEYEIWSYGPDQIDDSSDDIWATVPMG